jgi:hypothetical protein
VTFLELCQSLRRQVGAAGTGPANVEGQTGESARLVEWVRGEWLRIQQRHERWRFAWATGEVDLSPEFREFALPQDLSVIDEQTLRIGKTIVSLLPWERFRSDYRDSTNVREPRIASIAPDGLLYLESEPPVGARLTFEYWRTPQTLASNSDVPRCPAVYHDAIVYAAMIQYGLYENAPEVVQQGRNNFAGVYQEMVNRELPNVTVQGPLA